MKKKAAVTISLLLILIMAGMLLTGCHGTYVSSEQDDDQDIIIQDNTGDEEVSAEPDIMNIPVDTQTSDKAINVTATDDSVSSEDTSEGDASEGSTEPHNPSTVNPAYEVFDNALFIGDSRTQGLQLYTGIKNADFFCAKGMTIDKINDGETVNFSSGTELSIYDVLDDKEYKRVYIGLGMNELGMKYIEDFVAEYDELIATVKEKQPDAVIYVQALLPVTQEKSDNHDYVNNGQIYWYNTHIVEIAENNGVMYINADAPLVDENGALSSEATTDGVHMNKEYCIKWADEIAALTQ